LALSEATRSEAVAFIEANLPLVEPVDLPGVELHLAGPRSGLSRLQRLNPDFCMPYWAHLWGGGRALVPFLAQRPEVVAGRRVLDVGSGSGVVSIAAGRAGASAVFAIDVDPYAVAATELNTRRNGITATCLLGDVATTSLPEVDVLLVGDVFYDYGLAERMTAFLDHCLAEGLEVLVGDPLREFLPLERLQRLATYQMKDFGSTTVGPVGVFRYVATG
jgi:predicted nicotinamide N-methyase